MPLKFLLDTNVCINYLNDPLSKVSSVIRSTPANEIAVCSIVKAELFFGSRKSKNPTVNLAKQLRFLDHFASFPFDDRAANEYADIRALLAAKGQLIGPYDMQIAAIAVANGLTLVTHNTSEFSRIADLNITDWEE
ncbi:MAG: type II toxin-antitoxin system VapC family toxin [Acidobacteriota bacterium]|nr:MAG: type II toxin-antitoxin system VapC family toxin [Acidobacteriota bacterium]